MWDICGREQRRWRGADGEESVLHTCGRYRVPGTQERTLNSGESSVWCCGVCAPGVEVAWCAAGRRGETSLFSIQNCITLYFGAAASRRCCSTLMRAPFPSRRRRPLLAIYTPRRNRTPPALSPALLPYVKALHTQTPSTLTLEKTHNSHLSLSRHHNTHTRLVAHPITHIKLPSARPIIIG